jgi:hypothetical protein
VKRVALVLSAFALLATACSPPGDEAAPTPTPAATPTIDTEAISEVVLDQEDVGDELQPVDDPTPTTVQIGGQVGPAGFNDALGEATSAFVEVDGSGVVSNTVYLLKSADKAERFLLAHREAETSSWTQARDENGIATFELVGPVADLAGIGDDLYTARMVVTIVDAAGTETEREVEYAVYRVDRLLSFVVAQDLEIAALVRLQEQKMTGIVEQPPDVRQGA